MVLACLIAIKRDGGRCGRDSHRALILNCASESVSAQRRIFEGMIDGHPLVTVFLSESICLCDENLHASHPSHDERTNARGREDKTEFNDEKATAVVGRKLD